jgi:hypothetical protein
MWTRLIDHAAQRGIEVTFTAKDIWELVEKQNFKCALSGSELVFPERFSEVASKCNASLDRIDSLKPYCIDNVQWVLKNVNFMKHKLTQEDFIELCRRISEYNSN